jgi:hypothetical protein
VPAYLRNGDTFGELGAGFEVSATTAVTSGRTASGRGLTGQISLVSHQRPPSGIRTRTYPILRRMPLPIGLPGAIMAAAFG